MKLNIGEFTVEVKVKNTVLAERNNVVDTINFLNRTSMAFDRAAEAYKAKGYKSISADFEKMSNDIYAALTAAGAYKDI